MAVPSSGGGGWPGQHYSSPGYCGSGVGGWGESWRGGQKVDGTQQGECGPGVQSRVVLTLRNTALGHLIEGGGSLKAGRKDHCEFNLGPAAYSPLRHQEGSRFWHDYSSSSLYPEVFLRSEKINESWPK
jgi:hypothetical protein